MKEKLVKNSREGINEKNLEIYEKYLCSCYLKSRETINTTYKIYKSNMMQFLEYLKEYERNRYLISENTIKNFHDI